MEREREREREKERDRERKRERETEKGTCTPKTVQVEQSNHRFHATRYGTNSGKISQPRL